MTEYRRSHIGAVVGGAIGGFAALAVILLTALHLYRRSSPGVERTSNLDSEPKPNTKTMHFDSSPLPVVDVQISRPVALPPSDPALALPKTSSFDPYVHAQPLNPNNSTAFAVTLDQSTNSRPQSAVPTSSNPVAPSGGDPALLARLYECGVSTGDIKLVIKVLRGEQVANTQLLTRLFSQNIPAADISVIVEAMRGHTGSHDTINGQHLERPPQYDFKSA